VLRADPGPPARVRVALLAAARAQQAHAQATGGAARPLEAATSRPGASRRSGRWQRSLWAVPSLAMAAAAAWLVFLRPAYLKPERDEGAREAQPGAAKVPARAVPQPTAAEPSAPAAVSSNEAPPEGSASERVAPAPAARGRDEAPRAQRRSAAAARNRAEPGGFALPPAGWAERGAPAQQAEAEVEAREASASPPAKSDQLAKGAAQETGEGAPSAGLGTLDAAPVAAARPAVPALDAALERRARAHVGAQRWAAAAADYRELLRRFPQHARAGAWRQQLERASRALSPSGQTSPAAR